MCVDLDDDEAVSYTHLLITGALNDEEEKELKKLLTKVYEHMYQDNDKCEK